MKDDFIINFAITLTGIFFQNTDVVLVKTLIISMPF